jgi:hypothetical protein
MAIVLLLALVQQPAATVPASPVARVEVTPARAEIQIGQTVRLSGRALDAAGNAVTGARIAWFAGGGEGSVDSTGLVLGGYRGTVQVRAVASVAGKSGSAFGESVVTVLPAPAARIEVRPVVSRVATGTRLTLSGVAYSAQNDRRDDPVRFASSAPRVVSVSADGRLSALAPGRATITARAGGAAVPMTVDVVANPVARLALDPVGQSVRAGDVVRFQARPTDASGKPVRNLAVRWSLAAVSPAGVAQVDDDGAFVAETPGRYTVSASIGGQTTDAVVDVVARRVGRGIEVEGRVPIAFPSAEVWVHPGGKCAYLSTISDRVYAIDVTSPRAPKIVDSMMTNARIVNDVMTTEDGRYGVFSREGASDRKNGIVVFDASDACHPKPVGAYTETVSGGVHSSFVYRGHVYLTDDATGSMRVIDIQDPAHPKEVGRWQTEQTEAGRYLHDIDVKDGLAYLAYWNDGLVILDVGKGIKGGSPEKPVLVSQFKYNLSELYSRVDQLWGLSARGTHTAWRHRNYVFVGDEVYANGPSKGLTHGNSLTFGRLHVIDVADIEHPHEVAWYEPTDGGVHNVWVAGDTLYLGNYQGGARALDVSGELKGDLLRQGREMTWILTADSAGVQAHTPFAWGAVVKDGNIYVPDINSGLWIMRLQARETPATP